jgi:ElaB/YqjD/DUF883 family membrane-anchored ribosome-binding protein
MSAANAAASTAKQTSNQLGSTISEGIRKLDTNGIEASARSMVSDLSDSATQMMQNASETLKDKTQELRSVSTQYLNDASEKTTSLIRQRPIMAVAIGVGVGLALGSLIKKSLT